MNPRPRKDLHDEPEVRAENRSARPDRRRRWPWVLLAAALAAMLLYLGGANYFLRSPDLQRRLFQHPEKLLVTWDRAWTLWPGRVHLEGVEIRGQNRNLQWWTSLDRVQVSVSLPRLFLRTFHARRISGRGATFHLRLRLPAGDTAPTGPGGEPLTPPVPGLDNPPEPPPEALARKRPGERPPGWKIHLDGIELDRFRRVWIDRYRLDGRGSVRGAMELQVRGELSVRDARFRFHDGRLTTGPEELLERVDLDLDVGLDPFRPRRQEGLEFLRFVSGDLHLETRTASMDFLDPLLARVPGLDLDGGGELTVEAGLDHGRPTVGSRFELVPEGVALALHGFEAGGAGRLRGEIEEDGSTRIAARFESFRLRLHKPDGGERGDGEGQTDGAPEQRVTLEGRGLTFSARTEELSLTEMPPPPEVEIGLEALEIPDVTAFEDWLPEGWDLRLERGLGSVAGHGVLDARTGTGRGEVTLRLRELIARREAHGAGDLGGRGDLEVRLEIPRFDLERRTFETADGRVVFTDLQASGRGSLLDWSARVDRLEAQVDAAAFRRREIHARRVTGRGVTLEVDLPETSDAGGVASAPVDRRRARRGSGGEGWRLRLDDLDLGSVRELRYGRYRLVSERSRVAATLDWRLGGPLAADRLSLDFEAGRVLDRKAERARATLLPRVDLRADLAVDELLPGVAGSAFLAHTSGTVHLRTRSETLTLLNRYLARLPELHLDGRGDLTVDAVLERGRLVPGTAFSSVGELDVAFLDYKARGSGRITGEVERGAGYATVLRADLDRFDLSWRDGPQHYVRGTGLDLKVSGPPLYLGAPMEVPDLRIEIHMPESEVPDLTVYNGMLPAGAGLRVTSGRGTLAAHADYDTARGTGTADVTLRADRLGARYGTTDLVGNLQLTTRVPDMRLEARRFDLSHTRLDIRRAVVAGEPMEAGWWMVVELPKSRLDLGTDPYLEARVKASMRDSSPLTAYLESRRPMLRWVEGALTVRDVEMGADLRADPELYRLRDVRVTGRRLEILGELRVGEDEHGGLFHVQLGPLSAALEMLDGRKDFKLVGSKRWFEEKRARW